MPVGLRIRAAILLGCLAVGLVAGLIGRALAVGSSMSSITAWVSPTSAAPAPTGAGTEGPGPESAPVLATLVAPADPASIKGSGARLFGWALLDRRTGRVAGSTNLGKVTNTVESMIKPWIAADYLRRLAEAGREPSAGVLDELTAMIVDSHDPLTEKYYQLGGADAVVRRLISRCDLTRVSIKTTLWSWTLMTPQDAVRYGLCLADGRAAGPRWTSWILDTMRDVRGTIDNQRDNTGGGRWGIIDALPPELARDTSIKNGWTSYRDGWHVNCLAVHPDWVLAVMIRTTKGLRAAAAGCESVAASLVTDPSVP